MARVENSANLLRDQAHIWSQIFSFKNSASLKCAVQLGMADVVQKHEKEGYVLTSAGRLLLKDEPMNARSVVLLAFDPAMVKPWNFLSDVFQNDEPCPFDTAHGQNFWDYNAVEPKLCRLFNEGMASDSHLITKVLVTEFKYVFEGLTSLVDVGGGTGTVARTIAKAFPNLKCTVLDLPHVVGNQEGTQNLNFVAGDMLEEVPPANAILLKWILHDGSDEDCVKMLENRKKAIPGRNKGGKVIIIDMVMESQLEDHESVEAQICLDMQMLVLYGAKERTEKEWATLFWDADFSSYIVFPVLGTRGLIEVYS